MPKLNSEERARVLAMLECGRTQEQVARRFNVSRSSIRRFVRRVRVTGTFANQPRLGRPRVTSVRLDNFIRQRHLRNRRRV
jgi:transposase